MAERLFLKAKRIIGENQTFVDHGLAIESGRIREIRQEPTNLETLIELGEVTIAPGLLDLHINGICGFDVMDGSINSIISMSASLAKYGVTGFLATSVTAGWERTLQTMDLIGQASELELPGAKLLGGYSEGIFLATAHKGAHNEEFFVTPTIERLNELLEASRGSLRIVAIAPEIDGAIEAIKFLTEQDVKVLIGHTDATFDQTMAALNFGARGGIHLFNGMRGIHHREPGCAGALLLSEAQVEVIADGEHLHPAMLDLVYQLKGTDRMHLVSDCINAGGFGDGRYRLGEVDIEVANGVARSRSGSLAGSTLTLDRAVKNMVDWLGLEWADAIRMASFSPARFLGVDNSVGSIAEGKSADLAIFGNEGRVIATLVDGKVVFSEHPDLSVQ